MAKKKTTEHYKNKRDDIRKRKRKLTSSAQGMDSEQVKTEKKRLKEEYRGLKRSEKQQVKREIEEALEESEMLETAALCIVVGEDDLPEPDPSDFGHDEEED